MDAAFVSFSRGCAALVDHELSAQTLTSDAPVLPACCRDWQLGFPGVRPVGAYGVDATAMSLEQHGWDIHAV